MGLPEAERENRWRGECRGLGGGGGSLHTLSSRALVLSARPHLQQRIKGDMAAILYGKYGDREVIVKSTNQRTAWSAPKCAQGLDPTGVKVCVAPIPLCWGCLPKAGGGAGGNETLGQHGQDSPTSGGARGIDTILMLKQP